MSVPGSGVRSGRPRYVSARPGPDGSRSWRAAQPDGDAADTPVRTPETMSEERTTDE
jgi:hypothetical protein